MTTRYPTDGNDASFPIPDEAQGLTKRELFAAMAMQGFASAGANWHSAAQIVGETAVRYADALIEALNEE